jgi:FeS assembly SUF system protein
MGGIAVDLKEIEGKVVEAIKTCYDPEIPVDIYELGLIYGVEVDPSGSVEVTMTLTSPNCPSAVELPGMVEAKVRSIPGVMDARVEVVFDPPWEPSRMSEAARLQLGML